MAEPPFQNVDNLLYLNSEYDHLLYELETSDSSSVGLVLKAIYDGDEHYKFMERLDARIKNHDRDIEKMCNFHYQGFIDSIRELLQVRTQAQKLKTEISAIDTELRESGEKLVKKAEELVKFRQVQNNIALALESLAVCQPVLDLYTKLCKQMKEKRYYPALKCLEQLEHTYLPRVDRYRFALTMRSKIPLLRNEIKEASMSELRDFLESIRKVAGKIGAVAMRQISEQQNTEAMNMRKERMEGDVMKEFNFANFDISTVDEDRGAQELVDFSPVYRCLHIYSVLGIREEFETYYRQQRHQQARLASQAPSNMYESMESYENYFSVIVGFLVVEGHILNTANGLVSKAFLDTLWDNIRNNIINSLHTHIAHCKNDTETILRVKRLILLFTSTLSSYGYPVGPLFEMLLELKDTYLDILFKQWSKVFFDIFDSDNFRPITVDTPEAYKMIQIMFPFSDPEFEKLPFPKKLPFSEFVPKVYNEVKEFIFACYRFAEELNMSQTEMEELVRKSTNQLLTRTLSESLSMLINKPNLGLFQLIQITLNMNHLENASVNLEKVISEHILVTPEATHLSKLHGSSMFKDARADAEDHIYQQLNKKIDDFFGLASYDWMMGEPSGQASSYLSDLIAFLKDTFESFTNLPKKVAQTACLSACNHIANSLLRMLLDDNVKQVSFGALQQLNLDVMQCEVFANSQRSLDEENTLPMCFAELRQLLDLIMIWDWSNFFMDYRHDNSYYPRVNPLKAISLLEKMKEADKKTIFAAFKKNERDKKKLVDNVLKQLRQLVSNGS